MTPECRLYLISPPTIDDIAAFGHALAAALDAGHVAAFQVRLKDQPGQVIAAVVDMVLPICHGRDVAVILNDDPALAKQLHCDGVHVGQSDASLTEARKIMGPEAMIGVTCHDSRHLAMEAAEGGADYVAFGAFFPTTTKDTLYHPEPDVLTIWQESMEAPCVAIGGITADNAEGLAAAGADFLAVCGGVWNHPEGPAAAVRAIEAAIARGVARRA
jgi:thiamine-phosphate pyrophosphorylase